MGFSLQPHSGSSRERRSPAANEELTYEYGIVASLGEALSILGQRVGTQLRNSAIAKSSQAPAAYAIANTQPKPEYNAPQPAQINYEPAGEIAPSAQSETVALSTNIETSSNVFQYPAKEVQAQSAFAPELETLAQIQDFPGNADPEEDNEPDLAAIRAEVAREAA
jgi:hypothetical protein